MMNSADPTPLRETLEQLVPELARHDKKLYYELDRALRSGENETFWKVAAELDARGIRWAVVGNPQRLAGWRGEAPKVFSDSEKDEVVTVLTNGFSVHPIDMQRVRRTIEALILTVPPDEVGPIFLREQVRGDTPFIETMMLDPRKTGNAFLYLLLFGRTEAFTVRGPMESFMIDKQKIRPEESDRPVRTRLHGGSYSTVTRISYPDGSTVIEKRADRKQDGGKLFDEATYIKSLEDADDPAGKWFPKIHSVSEENSNTVVMMEDVPWPNLSHVVQRTFFPKSLD